MSDGNDGILLSKNKEIQQSNKAAAVSSDGIDDNDIISVGGIDDDNNNLDDDGDVYFEQLNNNKYYDVFDSDNSNTIIRHYEDDENNVNSDNNNNTMIVLKEIDSVLELLLLSLTKLAVPSIVDEKKKDNNETSEHIRNGFYNDLQTKIYERNSSSSSSYDHDETSAAAATIRSLLLSSESPDVFFLGVLQPVFNETCEEWEYYITKQFYNGIHGMFPTDCKAFLSTPGEFLSIIYEIIIQKQEQENQEEQDTTDFRMTLLHQITTVLSKKINSNNTKSRGGRIERKLKKKSDNNSSHLIGKKKTDSKTTGTTTNDENIGNDDNDGDDDDDVLLMKICWECGRDDIKVLVCTKCKVARYCSKGCQRLAWNDGHRTNGCSVLKKVYANYQIALERVDKAHLDGDILGRERRNDRINDNNDTATSTNVLLLPSTPSVDYVIAGMIVYSNMLPWVGNDCSLSSRGDIPDPSIDTFYNNLNKLVNGEWVWPFCTTAASADHDKQHLLDYKNKPWINLTNEEFDYFYHIGCVMSYDLQSIVRRKMEGITVENNESDDDNTNSSSTMSSFQKVLDDNYDVIAASIARDIFEPTLNQLRLKAGRMINNNNNKMEAWRFLQIYTHVRWPTLSSTTTIAKEKDDKSLSSGIKKCRSIFKSKTYTIMKEYFHKG